MTSLVHIGLGGNLGRREENLRLAAEALAARPGVRLEAASALYQTKPVGPDQPDYLNACLALEVDLEPEALLDELQAVETDAGRDRSREVRWGPRPLDLDVLIWEDRIMDTPRLKVPHPEMHRRAFVLRPLSDIAPLVVHPILGRTVADLLDGLDENGVRLYKDAREWL